MRPDEHFRDVTNSAAIVVADTSPLNYLVQIECVFLLPLLYRRVIIPPAVLIELSSNGAPRHVSAWASALPEWIDVLPLKAPSDGRLSFLGAGERDAIQLALEIDVPTVLIDEQKGRHEAHSRGLATTGTLGVLIASHRANLVDARDAFNHLLETTFRSTSTLRQDFLNTLRAFEEEDR